MRGNIDVVGDAVDGRKAVHAVSRLNPHVVIMDIAMPELNGIEAMRQILEMRSDTRVIILSMYGHTQTVRRALRAGARGYLLKESAGKEVAEAVDVVQRGGRYLSHEISEIVLDDYVGQDHISAENDPVECLSAREREILTLVVEGKSSAEIAGLLCLSIKSIETYRNRMMRKLGVRSLFGLVKFAIKHDLMALDDVVC